MSPLTKAALLKLPTSASPTFPCDSTVPLQVLLGRDPWRVAVASMLLNRTRRRQAEPTLRHLLRRWSTAAELVRAELAELMLVVHGCGFARIRSRRLQRFSAAYLGDWTDFAELPGVGKYTADAVALFCCEDTSVEPTDHVLLAWKERVCTAAMHADNPPKLTNPVSRETSCDPTGASAG